MNNSLINRNTTVLVLIILILGFIYMNLENNKSMTGGVDCEAFAPVVKKLIGKDMLYSFTIGSTPGIIIYIILILILLFFAWTWGKYELTYVGVKVPLIGDLGSTVGLSGHTIIDWAAAALYKFYLVRNDTYFYGNTNAPGASGTTTTEDQKELLDIIHLIRTPAYKPTVDNFCEQIQPCSQLTACGCKGAIACTDPKKLSPAAAALLSTPSKQKQLEQFYGIIPKCCCVLSQKTYSPTAANMKDPKKAGKTNPNYGLNIHACHSGNDTVGGINDAIKKSSDNPEVNASGTVQASNPDAECANVDCTAEPDYALLATPAFDGKGNMTNTYAQLGKSIISKIIQNTPSADLINAYNQSTFNSANVRNIGVNTSLSDYVNLSFSPSNINTTVNTVPMVNTTNQSFTTQRTVDPNTGKITISLAMGNAGPSVSMTDYSNYINTQVNTGQSPSALDMNNALRVPAPSASANGPNSSGFTSKIPKDAKKIKKNKQ